MAHSIQVIEERSFVLNDLDAIVLMCMMMRSVQSSPHSYLDLQEIVDHWRGALRAYAPGGIDFRFDMLTNDLKFRAFSNLMNEVRICSENGGIDINDLIRSSGVKGIDAANYPLRLVRETISTISRYVPSRSP